MPRCDGNGPKSGCKRENCDGTQKRERRNKECLKRKCIENSKEELLEQKEKLEEELDSIDKKLENL